MSKTPYEIRLELLKMAKEMLEADYYAVKEQIQNEWHAKVDTAQRLGKEVPTFPSFPAYASAEQIIEKAKALNSFVSNN